MRIAKVRCHFERQRYVDRCSHLASAYLPCNEMTCSSRPLYQDKVVISNQDPVVIWIDGGSASATEVFAGALHDQCRAVVVGSNSFGKGLIQAVYGLKNRSGLVLTVAKYITPNGTNIQGSGIQPDVNMKLPFLLVPGLSSDTSKINFNEISDRLQPSMCVSAKEF